MKAVLRKTGTVLCDSVVDGTAYLCREVKSWRLALRGTTPTGPTYIIEGTVRSHTVPWLFRVVKDTRGVASANCLALIIVVAGSATLCLAIPLAGLSMLLTSRSRTP